MPGRRASRSTCSSTTPALARAAAAAPGLTREAIAVRYGVSPDAIRVIPYPPAHAIKIVIDRTTLAGAPGDHDVYGAQQHGPLDVPL